MKKVVGHITILSFICIFLMSSCNKDISIESPQILEAKTPATGSLLDNQGKSIGIAIHGNYYKNVTLNPNNYMTVKVDINNYGTYQLYSDTVNGCWFVSEVTYTNNTGLQTVILKGYGTPTDTITRVFKVYFLKSSSTIPFITHPTPHISSESDYFPMTVGSCWTEETSMTNAAPRDTIHYTVSPLTKVIGSYTYKVFTSTNKDKIYYRKDGEGHYYQYSTNLSNVGVKGFEYKFLDDQLPVGSTWQTDTVNGIFKQSATESLSLKIVLQCTIVSKDEPFQLHNQTVDSVIHIQEQLILISQDGKSNYTALFGIAPNDAYYAKKIGLIYYRIPFTGFYREAKGWFIQ